MPTILNRPFRLSNALLILHGIGTIIFLWWPQLTGERKDPPRSYFQLVTDFISLPVIISYQYFNSVYTNKLLDKRMAYVYHAMGMVVVYVLHYWNDIVGREVFPPDSWNIKTVEIWGVEVGPLIAFLDLGVLVWVIEREARVEKEKVKVSKRETEEWSEDGTVWDGRSVAVNAGERGDDGENGDVEKGKED